MLFRSSLVPPVPRANRGNPAPKVRLVPKATLDRLVRLGRRGQQVPRGNGERLVRQARRVPRGSRGRRVPLVLRATPADRARQDLLARWVPPDLRGR